MSESDSAKLAAVAWIREQMERHALTIDDLIAAGCFDHVAIDATPEPAPAAAQPAVAQVAPDAAPKAAGARPLYRNALGQSWDGQGDYPDWLRRAVNAGQSIEFYRVK
jgi:DNA-binding protein H-NS